MNKIDQKVENTKNLEDVFDLKLKELGYKIDKTYDDEIREIAKFIMYKQGFPEYYEDFYPNMRTVWSDLTWDRHFTFVMTNPLMVY